MICFGVEISKLEERRAQITEACNIEHRFNNLPLDFFLALVGGW
jgi:hypothetical protein